MASTQRGAQGIFYESGHGHTPRTRFVRPAQGMPFVPPIDLSIPPPLFPIVRGTNLPITLPPPNLMPPGPRPLYSVAKENSPSKTETLVPPIPPPPVLLVPYNAKYIMKFNNVELLPQYLIEEELRHRFGAMSCLVKIQRHLETGAPIADDEVEIQFDDLTTAQEAFKDLSNEKRYSDLHFHEACVPPAVSYTHLTLPTICSV